MLVAWLLFTVGLGAARADGCAIMASRLRCEGSGSPVVSVLDPRLTWWATLTDAAALNQSVAAYEVIVASSSDLASKGVGDLWDTGVVEASAPPGGLRYGGKTIAAFASAWWRVRLFDASMQVGPLVVVIVAVCCSCHVTDILRACACACMRSYAGLRL
jgi:hypothetical protein